VTPSVPLSAAAVVAVEALAGLHPELPLADQALQDRRRPERVVAQLLVEDLGDLEPHVEAHQVAHVERFIERFRYKATKARQVQSRIKMLEKMERTELLAEDQTWRFNFPSVQRSVQRVALLGGVALGMPMLIYQVLRFVTPALTPSERRWWGVMPGDRVAVFDTDCGVVAILVCYDIEFPELVRIAQHHVEGALFTSQYYADSPVPFVKDFGERFRATFDEEPAALAAQAYDAANLAIVQLARGRVSREELREGVLAIRAYPGVSGVLRMSADGNAHKRPFLLGVEHGHVTQID